MSRHQRMSNYLQELKTFRIRYQKSYGPITLADIDREIERVTSWLIQPTEAPPHTWHGLHVNPHKDRNIKVGINRKMTNRHINN